MRKFIQHWLNFTSGERRGIIILALFSLFFISARWWFPVPSLGNSISSDSLKHLALLLNAPKKLISYSDTTAFTFNISTADSSSWVKAGLTPKQARTVTNYLSKGGKIKDTTDLWKLYFMDSTLFLKLKSRIIFDDIQFDNKKTQSFEHKIKTSHSVQTLELNSADSSQLVTIKGIGPVFAVRIIRYRKLLGGFVTLSQLNEVYGLSEHLTPSLLKQFTLNTSLIKPISINKATFVELLKHPYIGKELASKITKARKNTNLTSDELQKIISAETFIKLSSYVAFD